MNGKNTQYVEMKCIICGNVYYRPASYDMDRPKTCGKGRCPQKYISGIIKEKYRNAG